MQYDYKVTIDRVQHVWVANVEAKTPEARVLLRNESSVNLEHCLEAIRETIQRHVLNPWGDSGRIDHGRRPMGWRP